jgi:hypothetical protein
MAGLAIRIAAVIEPGVVPGFDAVTARALAYVMRFRFVLLMAVFAIRETRMIKVNVLPSRGARMTLDATINIIVVFQTIALYTQRRFR